jgi:hypothetical protein
MSLFWHSSLRARSIRLVDLTIGLWILLWVGLGLLVTSQVRSLAKFSETIDLAADAVDQTADGLHPLGSLPFAGPRISVVESRLRATAANARVRAEESTNSVERLSIILGLTVALAPTVPVVAAYVSARRSRAREVRAVRRALMTAGGDPAFEEFLARRAADRLAYHALRRISPNPWRDLEEGRFEALARAELDRLGIGERRRRAFASRRASAP